MAYKVKKLDKKIELIKALHRPIKKAKLMDLIDSVNEDPESKERTLRNYKKEGDIEIGNVIIPFNVQQTRDKRTLSNSEKKSTDMKIYDLFERSTVHPIVLPLNLTEVYMLTTGILNNLGKDHREYGAYKDIADKIYSQLSDYGKERINKSQHDFKVLDKVKYTSEEEMIEKHYESAISMSLKSNERFKITLYDDSCIYGQFVTNQSKIYLEESSGKRTLIEDLGYKNIEKIK